MGDAEAVAAFFADQIKDKLQLAALVNNAGITKDGFLVRMKDEDFDRVLTINLRGAFLCTREAAKIMSKNRRGRIVNISSVVGQMGNAGQVNYAAAKAGLLGLTKSCAKELAARNITVNAVAPGFIETDMTAALSDEVRAAYARPSPQAHGDRAGDCRCGILPRVGQGRIHHRPGAGRQRRHVLLAADRGGSAAFSHIANYSIWRKSHV